MLIRNPVAAGRFYPAAPADLIREVRACLDAGAAIRRPGVQDASAPAETEAVSRPWGLMLPHAGYVYCGRVLGTTLAGVELPRTLVVLCPNHTGAGPGLGRLARGRLAHAPGPAARGCGPGRRPHRKGRRQWGLRGGHAFPSGGTRR